VQQIKLLLVSFWTHANTVCHIVCIVVTTLVIAFRRVIAGGVPLYKNLNMNCTEVLNVAVALTAWLDHLLSHVSTIPWYVRQVELLCQSCVLRYAVLHKNGGKNQLWLT